MGNAYLSQWLDRQVSWQRKPLLRLLVGIMGMLIYTVGAVYSIIFVFNRLFGLGTGSMNDMLIGTILVTTIISLFMTGREFLFRWRDSAVQAERLQRENVKAQYENLKSQISPHFLFNSLNALTNLVHADPDRAIKFIKQLSGVYRFILDTRDKEVISLQEELNFLASFIYLQQIRCGDKLRVNVQLDHANGYVAPMALQMLVENAIKHNAISEEAPLAIDVFVEDGYAVVKNNVQAKTRLDTDSKGLGLKNIRDRYELISDKPVVVEDTSETFAVRIPIVTMTS